MDVDTERASKEDAPAAGSKSPPRSVVAEPDPKRSKFDVPGSVESDEEDDRPVLPDSERPPKVMHVILLGGIPGAGVKTASTLLRAALESYGATVTVIDDEAYHVRAPPCPLCVAPHVTAKVRGKPRFASHVKIHLRLRLSSPPLLRRFESSLVRTRFRSFRWGL